jgi:hypothetical protein
MYTSINRLSKKIHRLLRDESRMRRTARKKSFIKPPPITHEYDGLLPEDVFPPELLSEDKMDQFEETLLSPPLEFIEGYDRSNNANKVGNSLSKTLFYY